MLISELDKFFEGDSVAVATGDPLVPGSDSKVYTIPDKVIWTLTEFGGSSNIDSTEVELLYSDDEGSTWTNPYDDSANKLRCIHLGAGTTSKIFFGGLRFVGSGTDVQLKMVVKNYNQVNEAEIVGWFNGIIDEVQ